jgi:hypothetical protein
VKYKAELFLIPVDERFGISLSLSRSLSLKEEHILRMFENKRLIKIFVHEREQVRGREEFCNDELHNL